MHPIEILNWYSFVEAGLFLLVAVAGLVGAVLAAMTREDAFPAGDRQGKWVWVGLLVLSALVVATHFPFLSWAGMVVIGVYFFDVRPQLKDIISGNYGW
ncbi:DUF2516 family protein [Corynebacterium tapiri]|uniref:DUF2516 family protein n=1 Tax=Corynebacterium tapiri TaxID=1448266 RepID=A0A5C4U4E5_9CORY|nr:DUF2516 family protein [Corynebacterium tapiri]TNL97322.1 DUF2516 family protein [Corynebacterium tapiri]